VAPADDTDARNAKFLQPQESIKECLTRQSEGVRDALQTALDAQAGEPAKIDQFVAKFDPIAADGGGRTSLLTREG
jgi:hypothetical protein